jgi:hypothetical protein
VSDFEGRGVSDERKVKMREFPGNTGVKVLVECGTG